MLQKILPSLIWCIFLVHKSEGLGYNFDSDSPQSTSNAVSASASGAAQVSNSKPAQPNFLVDLLARSISEGLLNSDVLLSYSIFRIDQPHDLLFRVGSAFLKRAGVYDPALAEVAAAAVKKAGYVDSHLFFDAIGYMVAKFLFAAELVKNGESVTYFSLRILSAIDLVACTEGVHDTESLMNSVAGGLFKVFGSLELVTYDNLAKLFYFFADEIDEISHKIPYDFSEIDL